MADANKMITRAECNTIAPGAFTGDLNRCPTKAEIVASGKLAISGSYADNQLVKAGDVSLKAPSLSISPTTLSIAINGGLTALNVTSNTTWKVTYPSWCSGVTSGTGNSQIMLTVASNAGNASRSGSITVTTTAPSENVSQTCAVSQSGLSTITFRVWGMTSSNACKVRASSAVKDAMMVQIAIDLSDLSQSSGTAAFRAGDTEVSASIWPPIFDESTVTGYRITGVSYNGTMYKTSPLTTGNAIYRW